MSRLGNRRAEVRALHRALLGDQADRGDAERLRRMRQPDRDGGAASAGGGVRLLEHLRTPDRLEGVVGAACTSPPAPARPRRCPGHRSRGWRRGTGPAPASPVRRRPRRADARRPGPHRAAPTTRRRRGRRRPRSGRLGPGPCSPPRRRRSSPRNRTAPRSPAAATGRSSPPTAPTPPHGRRTRTPRGGGARPSKLGVRRRAGCRRCWRRHPARTARPGLRRRGRTRRRRGRRRRRPCHPGANPGASDCEHLAGGLVAEQHRHHPRPRAVDHGQVRVAQPGRPDPDQQLTRSGRGQLDLFDPQRPRLGVRAGQAHLPQYGAAHDHPVIPSSAARMRSGTGTGRRSSRSTNTCTNRPVAAGWSEPSRNRPIS